MNKKTAIITTLLIITLSLTVITTASATDPDTVAVWHCARVHWLEFR